MHRGTNQQDLAGIDSDEVTTDALGVAGADPGPDMYTRDNDGRPLAKRTLAGTPSDTKYYLKDALGSVASLTDHTGAQTAPSSGAYRYDPYGAAIGAQPTGFLAGDVLCQSRDVNSSWPQQPPESVPRSAAVGSHAVRLPRA